MRSGSAPRRPARGFTYLALLLLVALQGALLAAAGSRVSTTVQRDRESELRFRGGQIRDAIGRYAAAREPHELPRDFDALLEDRRFDPPRHHLRRAWTDPFTGRADWVELRSADGTRLHGVHSRSDAPRLQRDDIAIDDATRPPRVADWQFIGNAGAVAVPRGAPP